jgi:hypothetical protein
MLGKGYNDGLLQREGAKMVLKKKILKWASILYLWRKLYLRRWMPWMDRSSHSRPFMGDGRHPASLLKKVKGERKTFENL